MEDTPKVSIVLPIYNGAKYMRKSIDSCLNQTYKNIELIIVDDASTDETPDIIKSYTDNRIRYIRHEKNKYLPAALNTGFARATGDYLTWTSDDNYYADTAIEKMLNFLIKKNASFVYCDFYRFKITNPSNYKITKLPDELKLEKQNDVGPCFLYEKKIKKDIGEYDPNTYLAEDCDYWIRVSKKFKMYHLSEPLYYYGEHIDSLTANKSYDIRIMRNLVRIKNDVIDIEEAVDDLLSVINRSYLYLLRTSKYLRKIQLDKKVTRFLFSMKIRNQLKEYKFKNKDLLETKLAIKKILISRFLLLIITHRRQTHSTFF